MRFPALAALTLSPAVVLAQDYVISPRSILSAKNGQNTLWERSLTEEFGVHVIPGETPIHSGNGVLVKVRELAEGVSNGPRWADCVLAFDPQTSELLGVSLPDGPRGREVPKDRPNAGDVSGLAVIPAVVSLQSGQSKLFDVIEIDKSGREFGPIDKPGWKLLPAGFAGGDPLADIPPSTQAAFDVFDKLEVPDGALPRVFRVEASSGKLRGTALVRVLPDLPFGDNFAGLPHSAPPAFWIGARAAWKVVDLPNSDPTEKVLTPVALPADPPGLAATYLGSPSLSEYTVQVDLRLPGPDAPASGQVGLINQRFFTWVNLETREFVLGPAPGEVQLKANLPENDAPFSLRIRVEPHPTQANAAIVKVGVWPLDAEVRPDEPWPLEAGVPLEDRPTLEGAPGLFHNLTQETPVFLDNLRVYR